MTKIPTTSLFPGQAAAAAGSHAAAPTGPIPASSSPAGAGVSVRENDRPLRCDPLSHDAIVRTSATTVVGFTSVCTESYFCRTCGVTWEERTWKK
jgi:hypothetical protein